MSASTVLTVAEVADALSVSRWTIYDRIHRGEIPTIQVGRAKRVPRAWLSDQAGEASETPALERRVVELERRLGELTEALAASGRSFAQLPSPRPSDD